MTKEQKVKYILQILKGSKQSLISEIEEILGYELKCKKCGQTIMNHYIIETKSSTWGSVPCGGLKSFIPDL